MSNKLITPEEMARSVIEAMEKAEKEEGLEDGSLWAAIVKECKLATRADNGTNT